MISTATLLAALAEARLPSSGAMARALREASAGTDPPVALFGDGSGGDVVIDTHRTDIDAILNARSIHVTSTGSITAMPGAHILLRASSFIRIDGPVNATGAISGVDLSDAVAIVQFVGATAEGGSGGGGGGGSGASGGGVSLPSGNSLSDLRGQDGNGKAAAFGFSHGTGSVGGIGGASPNPGAGGPGGNAAPGIIGVDITGLEDHLVLYPAGPGGTLHGSIPGLPGAPGVSGGLGSGSAAAGGLGGLGGIAGSGAGTVLMVSPSIELNALVESNGTDGGDAPASGAGAPTVGADAPGASGEGGGGGGSGGGGGAGGAGGLALFFSRDLSSTVTPTANPGTGGLGAPGALGGAGDGGGLPGGKGGDGADGQAGSPGFVILQKIW